MWRLEVEGLGRIERADVTMRPLTLFVGPNNSGKTYLATVLWGLIEESRSLLGPIDAARSTPAIERATEWIRLQWANVGLRALTDEDRALLLAASAEVIERRRSEFLGMYSMTIESTFALCGSLRLPPTTFR